MSKKTSSKVQIYCECGGISKRTVFEHQAIIKCPVCKSEYEVIDATEAKTRKFFQALYDIPSETLSRIMSYNRIRNENGDI